MKVKKQKLEISPNEILKNTGWDWILGENTTPYIVDELVELTQNEAEGYYKAGETLYKLFIDTAQYVIDNKLYSELSIPESLVKMIEYSWQNDKNWHLYGRFDLSGGLNNMPIKLIEFNADTATCLPETAVVQWASLKANGLEEKLQFNTLFEALKNQFIEIKIQNPNQYPSILFSSIAGHAEDQTNVTILMEAANEAGFYVDFEYVDQLEFDENEGLFKVNKSNGNFEQFNFWFKLVPWEFIAWDEPELCTILEKLVISEKLIVLNPPYTLLFQSKGMLKLLWELNPYHDLLLETKSRPILGKKSVKKVMFGREGANVDILNENGLTIESATGEYDNQKSIYQAYTPFLEDDKGSKFQAGLFFVGEPCGLGFRVGGEIIDNKATFCGHLLT